MLCTAAFSGTITRPLNDRFEAPEAPVPANKIDELVLAKLHARGIEPANLCTDEVFIRRVYLDVIGTLPQPNDVRTFLDNHSPDKRAALIASLLTRDEFADYWSMKWCDLLRVKSEFPVNLWPNAVQAYHRWVYEQVRQNRPYDQFVRDLLTSSGSNFRVPPVNFYRAVQGRTPAAISEAVALTFMGTRADKWPADKRANMAAFFSRIKYKGTEEWKEEIVCFDPAATSPLRAIFPDGGHVTIPQDQDPREVFANWLLTPKNQWFARAEVNRVWAWLMGRGIVHEPDDIRPDNPPVNAELLAYLESEFVKAHYDVRKLYRLILNSRTYQQSSIPRSDFPDAESLFAFYPVRRLDAEVLMDALSWLTGSGQGYESPIPEPFTFIPDSQRAIALADGSITSPFLELFGRPPRDSGYMSERNNQPNDSQRLHLLNSSDIQRRIERSDKLRKLAFGGKDKREMIRTIYLSVLSRYPSDEEVATAQKYFQTKGIAQKQAAEDLVWALINTKEFLYRH